MALCCFWLGNTPAWMQVVERRLEQAAEVSTGDARGVIDAHMQVLPAHAAGVGLAGSIARDAVSGADKPPELLDVEMNHVTGVIMDITPRGLSGFEVFEPRQAGPFQHPAAVAEPAEATVAGDTPTIWAMCLPVSR